LQQFIQTMISLNKNLTQFLILCFSAISCNSVPSSEYDQLKEQFQTIYEQNTNLELRIDSLESEIDYLKNGAPHLFAEIKQLSEEKKWSSVLNVYDKLRTNFPSSYELKDALQYKEQASEELAWAGAIKTNSIRVYENYLENFSDGNYVSEAKAKIISRKKELYAERLQNAKKQNSAYSWRSFLNDYPDDVNRKSIEQKIIKLEVDEIFADATTGRLPQSNRTGNYGSTSSNITISNSTQYELVLRYSGPSTRKVSIRPHGQLSLNLISGSYRVAASAGGLNYAGSESLRGDYSVKYYITRY